MSDFGTRLRMAMGYADISMRDLAKHLGVSVMAVSKWASGKCYPRSSHLMAICDRCGVSVDWLMQSGNPFTGQDIIEALRRELKDAANEAAARIEQLEATLAETIKLMTEAAREAGHWKGKYEAAGYPGNLDGWIEKAKALEAENARLREALKPFVAKSAVSYAAISHMPDELPDYADALSEVTAGDIRRARAALAGKAGT